MASATVSVPVKDVVTVEEVVDAAEKAAEPAKISRQQRRAMERTQAKEAAKKAKEATNSLQNHDNAANQRPGLFSGVSRKATISMNSETKRALAAELLQAGASEASVAKAMTEIGNQAKWKVKRLEEIFINSGAVAEAEGRSLGIN